MNRKEKTEKFASNALLYIIIVFLLAAFTFSVQAQEAEAGIKKESLFKKVYNDFLQYGISTSPRWSKSASRGAQIGPKTAPEAT